MIEFNRIFIIGLPKTATHSVCAALNFLGIRCLHYPQDIMREMMEGQFEFTRRGWRALANCGEHFYPQLDATYPGSKFILTTRDRDDWLRSLKRQFEVNRTPRKYGFVNRRSWYKPLTWKRLARSFVKPDFSATRFEVRLAVFGMYRFHAGHCGHVFDLHHRAVTEYFKDRPDDLLIMDVPGGDGWDKLCPFLGMDSEPTTPFPRRYVKQDGSDVNRED